MLFCLYFFTVFDHLYAIVHMQSFQLELESLQQKCEFWRKEVNKQDSNLHKNTTGCQVSNDIERSCTCCVTLYILYLLAGILTNRESDPASRPS